MSAQCPSSISHGLDTHQVLSLALGKTTPIALGDAAPFEIKTNPMSEDWRQAFDKISATRLPFNAKIRADHQRLIDGLLTFGGERVCMPVHEPDLDAILSRGRLFDGLKAKKVAGRQSRCHSNVAALWSANKDMTLIITGYALDVDGMWRQHSWAIKIGPRSRRILETTTPRIAYFGFVMTEPEADEFADANY